MLVPWNMASVMHSCCESQEVFHIVWQNLCIFVNRAFFSTFPVKAPANWLKSFLSFQVLFFRDNEKSGISSFFFYCFIFIVSLFFETMKKPFVAATKFLFWNFNFKEVFLNILCYRDNQVSLRSQSTLWSKMKMC